MRKFFIVFIGIIFGLIGGELGLRIIGFKYDFHLQGTKPNFMVEDDKTLDQRYTADKDLFWVPKSYANFLNSLQKNPPYIIFMGDSCTEFGDYPERFFRNYHNEPELNRQNVAKVGVGGWSSYQGLMQLKRDVIPLNPKVVFFYYGWNDHWDALGVADSEIRWVFSEPMATLLVFRVTQLLLKSGVYLGFFEKREDLRRVPLAEFKNNLTSMVTHARNLGIIPILITAASNHEMGKEPPELKDFWLKSLGMLVPVHEAYVNAVRDISKNEGVILCDLKKEFDLIKAAEPLIVDKYFKRDGIHFTPDGNEKVAHLLFKCIRDNNLKSILNVQ